MNNTKEILDSVVETQTKAINSFVETANKFQDALKSDNVMEKSTEIYKNWWESQMSIFKNISTENKVENIVKDTTEKTEDFYKNMHNAQLDAIKKATEFNLNVLNSLSSFGKPATETNQNFMNMNSTWNTLFESWTKTLNSTVESLSKSMPNTLNADLFKNALNTNTLYFKLQEFYKPFFNAFQSKDFSVDTMKSMFDPTQYKKVTEELFHGFFQTNDLNTLLLNNTKLIQDFFSTNQNTNKDLQEYWKLFMDKFPHLVSGDFAKFTETFKTMNTSLTETFSPLMKLIGESKEKENAELAIATLDKVTSYNVKLAQIQHLLYTAGQKVANDSVTTLTGKAKEMNFTSFQPFFNEWVALNEKVYSELFATDEFSTLKAELTTLSLEVKSNLEKQFENRVEALPLVVKSEMNELYQTIHDLKKTVKTLENKLNTLDKPVAKPAVKKPTIV